VSRWSRDDDGDSSSPLVSGPIRGQRAQTIAGLSVCVSAEKHKMLAGERWRYWTSISRNTHTHTHTHRPAAKHADGDIHAQKRVWACG